MLLDPSIQFQDLSIDDDDQMTLGDEVFDPSAGDREVSCCRGGGGGGFDGGGRRQGGSRDGRGGGGEYDHDRRYLLSFFFR
jgi:hypothetical protein